ncbi:MAG: IS4 family transposase [Candidatus Brocadiaceae bacterium]|nr:IS4 family transposase [Candidatus Brocadiaceae bacterium]
MVKIIRPIPFDNREVEFTLAAQTLEMEANAKESGFYTRTPKKITATALLLSFWLMQQVGKNSLRSWVVKMGGLVNKTISKQALNERLDERAVALGKTTLEKALNLKVDKKQIRQQKKNLSDSLSPFQRILIRDSTTQKLPAHLSDKFPGSHSHGNPTAIMRVQALFNFTEEKWEDFSISSYTDNDQSAAADYADLLQDGDLLLQDLGYFTLEWIRQLIVNQYVITKWDNKTNIYHLDGTKINLLSLVRNKRQVDISVLLGSTTRIPMRLVVRKLPKEKARKRIDSARKDRHSKANHSAAYYELLKYEIYLTNISEDILSAKQIAQLYGLRWHIEILFKSWKSYANFKDVFDKERMSYHRTMFTIYALLIEFVFLLTNIYQYVKKEIKRLTTRHLSILKFMDVVNDTFYKIILIEKIADLECLIPQFAKHATYEKRTKRKNTMEKYLHFNELCIMNKQT